MGVTGLCNLIEDEVPGAVKTTELKTYFGRRIAIDASIFLYQFLIAIQFSPIESTRVLSGFFNRTCKMLEFGIKPVFVFDGKAPEMKLETLRKRKEKAAEAKNKLPKNEDDWNGNIRSSQSSQGTTYSSQVSSSQLTSSQARIDFKNIKPSKDRDPEEVKWAKRSVRMDSKHVYIAKKLLRLLGVPILDATGEAESFCAQLCREGLVYGVATEDADVLVFGAPKMIRHMSSSSGEKIVEIDLDVALDGLGLTQNQLVDLSILIGCDYCPSIRGIGPKKGLKLLKSLVSIEKILSEKYGIKEKDSGDEYGTDSEEEWQMTLNVSKNKGRKKASKDKSKDVPQNWRYKEARKLFVDPDVKKGSITESDLHVMDPDVEGLIEFLCLEHQFDEKRIRAALERVQVGRKKSTQTRIDTFFKKPSASACSSQSSCLSQISIPPKTQEPTSSRSQPSTSELADEQSVVVQVSSDDASKTNGDVNVPKECAKKVKKKVTTKKRVKKVIRFNTNGGRKPDSKKKSTATTSSPE